jgi:hypothetical protein
MENEQLLSSLSDDDLLGRLAALLGRSRMGESDLVAHIGEVDRRRLYAREGSPSMFAYCLEVLHLSEAEAYLRITAARVARDHPVILSMLADGRLHLSGIAKLAPQLTRENGEELLGRAAHKTKQQIEELVAEVSPRPDVPAVVRKLPERAAAPGLETAAFATSVLNELRPDGVRSSSALRSMASVQALAPSRYRVEFTASAELREKLDRLRALMRGDVPGGDLAAIIECAVTEKLERMEAKRFAKTPTPRKTLQQTDTSPASRHIPAAVRRVVHERDGGRCRFVDGNGRRCSERHRLEYHHRHPFAFGGDHGPENICLMCPAHNRHLAELDYGRKTMSVWGGKGREARAVRLEGPSP